MEAREGIEGSEGKTTFARVGWLDVGSTRIPASGKGVGGGVKRLTVCYHGNATPLRQEEAEFNPLQSHCDSSPPSTFYIHSSCILRRNEGENDVQGTIPTATDYATNSVPSCFQSVFTNLHELVHRNWSRFVNLLLRLCLLFFNRRLNGS